MPDWLTHILFAYILCVVLSFKFSSFKDNRNVAVVMVGSLVPDLVKVELLFNWIGVEVGDFVAPLHTPVGSVLSAGLVSLLFYGTITVFSLLVLGLTTHFMLDLLLGHVSGGMLMLFPFSWNEYQLGVINSGDYNITVVVLAVAVVLLAFDLRRKSLRKPGAGDGDC